MVCEETIVGRNELVHLDCGCAVVVEHDLGERLVVCPDHNIEHVVSVKTSRLVHYRSRRRVQLRDQTDDTAVAS